MSRQTATIPLFSGGLNTEVSDLQDLFQYTKDEDNCVIFSDGSRGRRLGFNYERDYGFSAETAVSSIPTGELGDVFKPYAVHCFEWENYKGDGDTVLVVQIGSDVVFFKGVQRGVLSQDQSSYKISLLDYKVEGVEDDSLKFTKASFTSAYGTLFVSTPYTEVIRVQFKPSYEYIAQYPGSATMHLGGLNLGRMSAHGCSGSYIRIQLEDGTVVQHNLFVDQSFDQVESKWLYNLRTASTIPNELMSLTDSQRLGFAFTTIDQFNFKIVSPLGKRYNNALITLRLHSFRNNKKDREDWYTWTARISGAHDAEVSVEGGLEKYEVRPRIRDTKGIDDDTKNDFLPDKLEDKHKYNLLNQGWDNDKITKFFETNKQYPSNAMQWFVAKGSDEEFAPAKLLRIAFGSSQAPRGKFIMDAYAKDRASQSGISSIPPSPFAKHRPEDICFYSGRLWYGYDDTVLYSQILAEDCTLADRCYQAADPTSEEISDPVDTDGGHLQIQECGNILRMAVLGPAIIFFGTKGIVALQPGDNAGFTPTSYIKSVVSSVGIVGKWAVCEAGNAVVFWNHLGIYALGFSNGSLTLQPLTANTIQSFVKEIPDWAVENAIAGFNAIKNEVVFMYPSVELNVKRMNKMLTYNITRGTWTKTTIAGEGRGAPYIVDVVAVKNPIETAPISVVTASGEDVTVDGDYVTIEKETNDWTGYDSVSYAAVDTHTGSITFANMIDTEHRDWSSGDRAGEGYSFESYLISHPIMATGAELPARTLPTKDFKKVGVKASSMFVQKQCPYVTNVFKRTEEGDTFLSGCYMSARWDWSLADSSFKWTQKQQVYRPDKFSIYEEFVISKTRLRGSGRALQLKYENDGDKDFRLCAFGLDLRGWIK